MTLDKLKQVEIWYLEDGSRPPVLQRTTHGWAVRLQMEDSIVLTTRGEWAIEPGNSRRLDDFDQFIATYRFKTAQLAIDAYCSAKD